MKEKSKKEFEILITAKGADLRHREYGEIEFALKFGKPEDVMVAIIRFLRQIEESPELTKEIMEYVDKWPEYPMGTYSKRFRESLIRILEGLFGFKVGKTCTNCKSFFKWKKMRLLVCNHDGPNRYLKPKEIKSGCDHWVFNPAKKKK